MTISEIKSKARKALHNRWGHAVLITILLGIIQFIPTLIEAMLSGGMTVVFSNHEPLGSQIVGDLLSLFLIPLSIGYSWYFLTILRNQTTHWSQLFDPFDFSIYLKMLGSSLLVTLYTCLWTLLFLVPGIIKGIAYSQTFYILKDQPHLKVNEAITKSRELMMGYKWKYVRFILSFIGWFLLGGLTLGIGFLWIEPYFSASCAGFYESLIQETNLQES